MKTVVALLSILFFSTHYAQEINFEKLNELYYNLNDYDFNGFSADVEINLMDQLKNEFPEEEYISFLNDISMKINFFSKDSMDFKTLNIKETYNFEFYKGLVEMINGSEATVKGSLVSWAAFSLTPAFEPNKNNYIISEDLNYTKIQYDDEATEVIIFLNSNSNIDSISIINISADIKIYPTYETTDFNKRIIRTIVFSIDNYSEVKMNIIYQSFDKIMIPHLITITQSMQGMSQELKFTLKNISLM